uniref:Alpha-macroglobulin receptor-binding domain-containing protein n=1 Tax=Anas platyrhynchos platyrhynchos TaxID=8840 RepID=A0A493T6J7_ANAPP
MVVCTRCSLCQHMLVHPSACVPLCLPTSCSTVVRKALGCIAPSLPKAASTYTQALLAYTFALAKDQQRTQELLDMLDQKAIRAGGQIHWSQSPSETPSAWSPPLSVDVELTAYVLLALLSKPNVTRADLTTASGIVAWLTRQQNAYGGFASTQDTVVALQALAKYAALTYSTKGVAEVRVRSQKGFGRKFQVSYQNRLLVQEVALTEIPGKFSVQAHGSCCVFTRSTLYYNTPPPKTEEAFVLDVQTTPRECDGVRKQLDIHISVSYIGDRGTSNMVLVEVEMLSGFIAMKRSVNKVLFVKKTEIKTDRVTIYLEELDKTSLKLNISVEQDIEVRNLKPATVRVYDYYKPDDRTAREYNSPCSSG